MKTLLSFVLLGCAVEASDSVDAKGGANDIATIFDSAPNIDSEGAIEPCDAVPILTWANFGEGFVLDNCQACHAHGAADRHGAPAEVAFDTLDDVLTWQDRIVARAGSELGGMPPAGGVSETDRKLLLAWIACSLR
ncbi:MAG: c-type cytochrome [Myxococcales bacterium]|nr:c-type cytochrome [Myxococcales bacterium]